MKSTPTEKPRCSDCVLKVSGYSNSELSLPDIPSALVAFGAKMHPEVVHEDWTKRLAPITNASTLAVPSREQAKQSLWMSQGAMNEARDYMCYECHDLRLALVQSNGALLVMYCERADPPRPPNAPPLEEIPGRDSHSAPINGFYWPIGGRRACAKPGSPLDGKFTLYHSAVLKANQEAGVEPKNLIGIYNLGIGRTEFPRDMTYVHLQDSQRATGISHVENVHMANAQVTINKNLVLLIDSAKFTGDASVKNFNWLSEDEYRFPEVRARFCLYERIFLDALFKGWRDHRASGTPLPKFKDAPQSLCANL